MRPRSTFRHAPSRSANQNLLNWLGRDARMASVVATAQRYAQIRQAVAAMLPAGLADVLQVIKLDDGQLTLAVPAAAHVAKLRQLAPRLVTALGRQGWHVEAVNIRIQAQAGGEEKNTVRPAKTATPLDAQALQAFSTLHRRLSAGPLADAVQRLLKHHTP